MESIHIEDNSSSEFNKKINVALSQIKGRKDIEQISISYSSCGQAGYGVKYSVLIVYKIKEEK